MTLTLNVTNRQKGQKEAGMMPAVMYNSKAESKALFVSAVEFKKVLSKAGESTIVELTGDVKANVLINDVQFDPVKYTPTHADFYEVAKGQKVVVNIPLNFINDAPAIKLGANVVKVLQEVSVEVDAQNIPASFDVDLSKLADLNSNILVKDLAIPTGAKLHHVHEDDVIASAVAQADEDLSTPVQAVDMDSIAVVEKGKKEEVDAE